MKRHLTIALAAVLAMYSCKKTDNAGQVADEEVPQIQHRACASMEVLEQQMAADPSLRERMNQIDAFSERFAAQAAARGGATGATSTTITIPVVVNVVYNTTAQNISDAQIQSQIDVLNEDYNNANVDGTKTPSEFNSLRANIGVIFKLAKVVRHQTNIKSWSTNDAVKKTARGGQDPYDPAHNLNMWACNLGQGLLGYAQFPGGNLSTDGVVILYSAFGSSKKAAGTYTSTYDLGRTATHEVGHWLNLRHIWGDATCGNDQVGDTPVAQTSNYGCPSYPKVSSCTPTPHNEMTMNYMDYTDDACMYMFTTGQSTRMHAIFAAGGPRANF